MLDIDALLSSVALKSDHSWRKGDRRSSVSDRTHLNSGANFLASDADLDELSKQIADATVYLESNLDAIIAAASFPGVERTTLDFAVALAVERSVAVSAYLPPNLVRLAASANVGIEVSTYLRQDDGTQIDR